MSPKMHNGPTGNQWVAEYYYRALIGRDGPIERVKLADVERLEVPPQVELPIAQQERAWIAVGDQVLGLFGVAPSASKDYFAEHPGKSMIAFRPQGSPLVDSLFLVLPYELTEEMVRDATLPVELVDRGLGLWRVDVANSRRGSTKPRYLGISASDIERFEKFELQGERPFRIARTPVKDRWGVHCVDRSWVVVVSSDSQVLHPDFFRQSRVLDLVLEAKGVRHRIPMAFWQRGEKPAPRIGLDRPIAGRRARSPRCTPRRSPQARASPGSRGRDRPGPRPAGESRAARTAR